MSTQAPINPQAMPPAPQNVGVPAPAPPVPQIQTVPTMVGNMQVQGVGVPPMSPPETTPPGGDPYDPARNVVTLPNTGLPVGQPTPAQNQNYTDLVQQINSLQQQLQSQQTASTQAQQLQQQLQQQTQQFNSSQETLAKVLERLSSTGQSGANYLQMSDSQLTEILLGTEDQPGKPTEVLKAYAEQFASQKVEPLQKEVESTKKMMEAINRQFVQAKVNSEIAAVQTKYGSDPAYKQIMESVMEAAKTGTANVIMTQNPDGNLIEMLFLAGKAKLMAQPEYQQQMAQTAFSSGTQHLIQKLQAGSPNTSSFPSVPMQTTNTVPDAMQYNQQVLHQVLSQANQMY